MRDIRGTPGERAGIHPLVQIGSFTDVRAMFTRERSIAIAHRR